MKNYKGATIGPAPELTPDQIKKRKQASLDLLKKNSDKPNYSAFVDDEAMRTDQDYKQSVDEIIGAKPVGFKKKDGEWENVNNNKLEQFGAGVLRPFEKMVAGDKPSLMNAYNVPDDTLSTADTVARGAGELVGYGLEYAPVAKGVAAAGLGKGITKSLMKNQLAKTAGGELIEGGIKNRLKSYVGKKVIGSMVDDAIAGGIVAAGESRGDPTAIATGAVLGAATAPLNQYALKPVAKYVKKVASPYLAQFKSNLHANVNEGLQGLPEDEVAQVVSNPSNVASTVGQSIADTVDDVTKQAKMPTPNIGEIVDEKSIAKQAVAQNVQPGTGTKELGFVKTIKESPRTDPTVAKNVQGKYTPITNKETLEVAKQAIIENEDNVLGEVLSNSEATADQVAKAQVLIDKYSNEGKHEMAIQVVENMAKKLKAQGQSIQAASMWNRLTPAGILRTAERTFQQVNNTDKSSKLKLTKELADELLQRAQKLKDMPDGMLDEFGNPDKIAETKLRETQKMMKLISDQIPSNLLKKVDTAQTIGQLMNPKTVTRNVVGNAIFGAVDNAQQTLAAGIDKGVSLITGKRSVLAPNPVQQTKGALHGIKQGFKDAIQGIDTGAGTTQFDLPQSQVFKSKWNPFHWAEKGMNIALRAPDRAFYEAAKQDYIKNARKLAQINGVKFNLEEALQQADEVAKYRTFQDDTAWAQAFSGIKKALNAGKEFGVGSFIMKYPKTPANLLARAVDYSPVSFVRSMNTLGKTWFKGQQFNQAKFVTDISKGLTGTGLIGTAYYLTDLGIITGTPDKDKDIAAIDRQSGGGKYKLNVDALKRFVTSGFDPNSATALKGDKMVSYDWAQPVSTAFAIGANMAKGASQPNLDKAGKVIEAVAGGVDSLYEQPLLSGVAQVFRGGSAGSAAETIGRSALSSFVPTIVSQINQYQDNTQRDPFDPNFFKYAKNIAKSKVPGLAQELPQAYDVWGEPLDRYKSGTNTMFNVFFNPAFVSDYQPTDESQLVLDLYEMTGETKHAPKLQDRKVKAYGYTIEPDAKTIQGMQQYSGQRTREMYRSFMANEKFMNMPASEKVKLISGELSRIGADTKMKFFGDQFLEMADKSGDRNNYYQVKQDMLEHIETEQAKDIYDQVSVMSKDERKQYLSTLAKEYPELLDKVGDLKAADSYQKILSLPVDQRSAMAQSIPDKILKKVKEIRRKEMKKYGSGMISGLKPRFAAEMLYEQIMKLPEQNRKEYVNDLKKKGILKSTKGGKPTGVYKELLHLKNGKVRQTEKYLGEQF